jgi:8-oxo-dGTP pyrophosphatase MutT (NUDIX family)
MTTGDLEGACDPWEVTNERLAARVLLIDAAGRLLLFRGSDPARPEAGTWWFTPGGGVEPGESLAEAARREALEETGHRLPDDLGPVVLVRTSEFSFQGQDYRQTDHFFRVTATHSEVDYSGWTETDREALHLHRWWTPDELRETSERVFPEGLWEVIATRPPAPGAW